ncbi:MAG: RNA polymerase sigma factor [Bryobacteraceae bacterium]|jgi:RNA polymerase sigma-70 factor (ECF subfamily)
MNENPMADAAPETDDELLLRMHSGDEQAFVTLYRRRQPAIYRFARHMSGSAAIAEDITQDVFVALIREDCGYDPERGTLSGYLFGIARKLALRRLERGRADVALDTGSEDSYGVDLSVNGNQLTDLMRKEGIDALLRAIQALPHRYREVVALCDLEEVDYVEAAAILNCPVGTVRSRLHRARSLLLDKMFQERNHRPAGALKPARSLT